jgi:hypothetical protein
MRTENKVSARSDFISALVWMAFGLSIVIASWRMDRLESQGATFYTIPGLVPGVLGAIMLLLGIVLAIRAYRDGGHRLGATSWSLPPEARAAAPRVALVLVFSLAYAAGLLGHGGVPFWLATFAFVFLFILVFDWKERQAKGQTGKGILLAFIYSAGTAGLVSYVFQELFLVRLP